MIESIGVLKNLTGFDRDLLNPGHIPGEELIYICTLFNFSDHPVLLMTIF